jgi:MFS family permease
MPFQVLMPVFAKQVLGGGPHTLGFLMGATGLGALIGAIYLASRKSNDNIWNIIPVSAALFGIGLIAFSLSKSLWLSLLLLLIAGWGMMVQMASSNTLLQVLVDDDKRGRIMAFYAMAFMGMVPFGSLLAGSLAGFIGAPNAVLVGGALCILGAFALFRDIRLAKDVMPVVEKEITPEMEAGIESSEEVTDSL